MLDENRESYKEETLGKNALAQLQHGPFRLFLFQGVHRFPPSSLPEGLTLRAQLLPAINVT